MKKQVLLLTMMVLPMVASAYDAEIDGIYYEFNFETKTATAANGSKQYIGDIVIPSEVTYNGEKYSVTSIGCDAFYLCKGVTSITIPKSIIEIGNSAFYGCNNLSNIVLSIMEPLSIWDGTFSENTLMNATLYVPNGTIDKYKTTEGWKDFAHIEEISLEPCAKPTIKYEKNGKLTFSTDTEGATCRYTITDTDIKSGTGNDVGLSFTYNISVFATKAGLSDSEITTATLCLIEIEPNGEEITDKVLEVKVYPILIQTNGGVLTLQGLADKAKVEVYSINGVEVGHGISSDGITTINTKLNSGEIAVIKIGQKSVKVVIK